MKDTRKKDLGDVDTFFISRDRSTVVLLERKHSGSTNATSVKALYEQIRATKNAFVDPGTEFALNSVCQSNRGLTTPLMPATIISAVYFNYAPDNLFSYLTAKGIHVVVDAVEHYAPTN